MEIALKWASHLQAFFPGEPPSTFPSFTAITRSIDHTPQSASCGFLLLSVLTWVEAISLCFFFLESPLLAAPLNPSQLATGRGNNPELGEQRGSMSLGRGPGPL